MIKFLKYFFCLLFIANCSSVFSQNVQAYVTLDTNKIRIGEQTKIDLYITYSASQKNQKIQWPAIGDTLRKEVEVVNVSKIDTTIPDKNKPDMVAITPV